jgi:hypothetical protein
MRGFLRGIGWLDGVWGYLGRWELRFGLEFGVSVALS